MTPFTPKPIYRWSGEQKDPSSNLGWSIENRLKYHFPRFADGVVMYIQGSLPLPEPLVEVIESFVQGIPNEMWSKWNIDWNADTPAIQFHNKRGIISEALPVDNMFRCKLEGDYFTGLCESKTKDIAVKALRDHPVEWWRDWFGEFEIRNISMVEPRIVSKTKHSSRKNMIVVRYIDKYGVKTQRTVPSGEENTIPLDLFGDKTVSVTILPDERIIDDKDPFTLDRTVSIGKCRKDAIEYLAQQYKIRMQIPPEHQIWLTNQLLEFFANDEVGAYVEVFKCSLVYSKIFTDDVDNRLASIVIYVAPGKELARKVLNGLVKKFAHVEHLGLNLPSRYTVTKNRLIFYSGADGDMKSALIREGLIDRYFDRTSDPSSSSSFTGYDLSLSDI